jgi:hypothetical protein
MWFDQDVDFSDSQGPLTVGEDFNYNDLPLNIIAYQPGWVAVGLNLTTQPYWLKEFAIGRVEIEGIDYTWILFWNDSAPYEDKFTDLLLSAGTDFSSSQPMLLGIPRADGLYLAWGSYKGVQLANATELGSVIISSGHGFLPVSQGLTLFRNVSESELDEDMNLDYDNDDTVYFWRYSRAYEERILVSDSSDFNVVLIDTSITPDPDYYPSVYIPGNDVGKSFIIPEEDLGAGFMTFLRRGEFINTTNVSFAFSLAYFDQTPVVGANVSLIWAKAWTDGTTDYVEEGNITGVEAFTSEQGNVFVTVPTPQPSGEWPPNTWIDLMFQANTTAGELEWISRGFGIW